MEQRDETANVSDQSATQGMAAEPTATVDSNAVEGQKPELPQTDAQAPAAEPQADPAAATPEPSNPAPTAEEIAAPAAHGPHQGLGTRAFYRAANSGEKPGGNEYHAAIVTHVYEDNSTVDLTVFPRAYAPFFVTSVPAAKSEVIEPGTWLPR